MDQNEPYSGDYNATVKECNPELLKGTVFQPGENVSLMLETMRCEEVKEGVPFCIIGAISLDSNQPQMDCIDTRLLKLSPRALANLMKYKSHYQD